MNSRIHLFTIFSLLCFFAIPARAGLVLVQPLVPVNSSPFSIWVLGTECRDSSQDSVEFIAEQNLFQISLTLTASTCPEQSNPAANNFRTQVGPLPIGDYHILYKGFAVGGQVLASEQNTLSFSITEQAGVLDLPKEQEVLSGKGLLQGWVCEGDKIEAAVDDQPKVPVRSKLSRPDTRGICGDSKNGFELKVNWNTLGAGPHTIRVFSDGVEFASVRVTVRPMVRGQLETPSAGSNESGIGLIGGWVCDADTVSILIDGFPPFEAIYGGPRGDTRPECGDDANGFGLVMNWGLLGDGQHSLRVLADGVQFGSATFSVKTFGVSFFRHAPVDFKLSGFPDATHDTVISWSQAHQKFITSNILPAAGAPVVNPPENPGPSDPPVDPQTPNNPSPIDSSRVSLEVPQQQAILSGKGFVKGWVCDATIIEASLDDQPGKVPLNYRLSRPDTNATCGDDDNGFELPDIDWISLGAGPHVLHFFADGVEFATANVTIQSTTNKQGSVFAATDFKGSLDTPVQASFESGIGVIQGWACNAGTITVHLDGGQHKIRAIYGVDRSDTESICGDRNNGFGLVFNWGLLTDGEHTIQVLADGVEFGSARFKVQTYGVPFLSHAPQDYSLEGFPEPGRTTIVRWAQSQQNFVVVDVQ